MVTTSPEPPAPAPPPAPGPSDTAAAPAGAGMGGGVPAWRPWVSALLALVVSRAISTLFLAGEAVQHHTSVVGAMVSWDSAFYLAAAQHGWPHHVDPHVYNTSAFFPALPLAIRAVHLSGMSWRAAGIATDAVIEVGMAVALMALLRDRFRWPVAERMLWLVLLFPGAYVFALVYSEPLFILCAAVCLLALGRARAGGRAGWWVAAGLAAAVGGATRPTGIVLVACCVWAALAEARRRRTAASLVAPALAPAGLIAYLSFLGVRAGSVWSYSRSQDDAWQQAPTAGAIPHQIALALRGHPTDAFYIVMLGFGVVTATLLARQVRAGVVPAEWLVYALGCFLITLVSANIGFRPRFALTAFPLVAVLALHLRRAGYAAALAAAGAGLAALAYLTPRYVP